VHTPFIKHFALPKGRGKYNEIFSSVHHGFCCFMIPVIFEYYLMRIIEGETTGMNGGKEFHPRLSLRNMFVLNKVWEFNIK
jgi:hypothetical protein